MRDRAIGLLPDLWSGAQIMGLPVGCVGVLIEIAEPLWIVAGQFACSSDCAIGTLVRIRPVDLGAISFEDALSFR